MADTLTTGFTRGYTLSRYAAVRRLCAAMRLSAAVKNEYED